jgi:hypothetical protein
MALLCDIPVRDRIQLEPTWSGLLPAFIAVLEHGTDEGRRLTRLELARMALAADYWNAHAKAEGMPTDKDA